MECIGLLLRASTNIYYSSYGSIEARKSLRILKRHSCPGCDECIPILDLIIKLCDEKRLNIDYIEHGEWYRPIRSIFDDGVYNYGTFTKVDKEKVKNK